MYKQVAILTHRVSFSMSGMMPDVVQIDQGLGIFESMISQW